MDTDREFIIGGKPMDKGSTFTEDGAFDVPLEGRFFFRSCSGSPCFVLVRSIADKSKSPSSAQIVEFLLEGALDRTRLASSVIMGSESTAAKDGPARDCKKGMGINADVFWGIKLTEWRRLSTGESSKQITSESESSSVIMANRLAFVLNSAR